MKVGDKIYIVDRNQRAYINRTLDTNAHIQCVEIIRETKFSFFIKYYGKEYRYSKKEQCLVASNRQQGLYGISPHVFKTKEEAQKYLAPKTSTPATLDAKKDYTEITCDNGTVIKLEHKLLHDDFCDEIAAWAVNNGFERIQPNTFFFARATEAYIKATGKQPIYE